MGAIVTGAAASILAKAVIKRREASFRSWERTSFSGATVTLTEGIEAAAGVLVSSLVVPSHARMGAVFAVGASAAAGYIDDQLEDRFPAKGKGLKGHLGALRRGQLTSGALKIGVIGLGSAVGAAALPHEGGHMRRIGQWTNQAALIAGTANLVNLLDLRPGRALKASMMLAGPLAAGGNTIGGPLACGVVGASAVALPEDLAGVGMLGDLGANCVGAATGMALASLKSPLLRWGALGGLVGLTLASEKVSFSKVIEENRLLAWIDSIGRA
ncbi:hypothetical protein [Actinobaculum sp. 313]|uniref:hypothetical protein n=1 Tax=Actinobaculum sp. 313 TaxID=2495645 RepID=UPI000D525A81|nr:hypothetical protein [Actinobaculum sp. 313]AWE42447.1 hypothetical protein DDD63_06440 [Actinobaculum sp. 313]